MSREPITMRWVITHKQGAEGMTVKARLVARGFQDPAVKAGSLGVGACMAARLSSLHVLFTAAQRKWEVVKIDISGAFLKGEKLKRDVFLAPPPGGSLPRWFSLEGQHGRLWSRGRTF